MGLIAGIINKNNSLRPIHHSILRMAHKLSTRIEGSGLLYSCNNDIQRYLDIEGKLNYADQQIPSEASFGYFHGLTMTVGSKQECLQPVSDSSKKIWVVLDGLIHNRKELSAKISKTDIDNDGVLIAELYSHYGTEFIKDLNGTFSFSLYDSSLNKHVLCRDRGGSRSLFYTENADQLVFGSSIRSILVSGLYKVKVNWDGVWNNVGFPACPQPLTVFEGIHALERGQFLEVTQGKMKLTKYWRIPIEDMLTNPNMTRIESGELFHKAFNNAIQRRVIPQYELGSLLSGGVDSCYISALASQYKSNLKALTFGLKGEQFQHMNEADRASKTASMHHMDHVINLISIEDLAGNVDEMVDIYEQPGASIATNYYLAKMSKENGVNVLLNGLAADEQHGGFHYFKFIKLWKLIKSIPGSTFFIPRGKSKRIEDLKNLSLASTIDEYYSHAFSDFKEFEKKKLLPELNYNSYQTIRNSYLDNTVKFENDVQGLLYFMFANVPNHHLYRFDQFTKHFGVEALYPFLDNECIDAAFKIPAQWKVTGDERKIALKEASRKWIAQDSLAKKKVGLIMPMNHIVNVTLKELVLDSLSSLKRREQFSADYIDKIYSTYKDIIPGKIWKLVMLELWFQKFIDKEYQ